MRKLKTVLLALLCASPVLADTIISSSVTTTTTWTLANSPYIVTTEIAITAPLTIEPGVVVKFDAGGNFDIYSTITAVGTVVSPITFTSSAASPTPGSWGNFWFTGGSAASRLSYATITYGGNRWSTAVYIGGVAPTLDHVTVTNSSSAGISIYDGSGTPSITDSTISNNATCGIDVYSGASPTITTTAISNNGDYAIRLESPARLLGLTGMSASGNGGGSKNAVGYRAGNEIGSQTWPSSGGALSWDLTTWVTLQGAATLTIMPGLTVRLMIGNALQIGGTLNAVGTATNPITFTSTSATPGAGAWGCLYFPSSTSAPVSQLAYANIRYGGGIFGAAVYISNGSSTFDHVTISDSSSLAAVITGGSASFTSSSFATTTTGFTNSTGSPVTATLCYWGSADGPHVTGGTSTGTNVSANVVYEPWLTSPASSPLFISTTTLKNKTFNPTIATVTSIAFTTSQTGNWTATILNSGASTVRTLTGSGITNTAVWDGKDGGGAIQPNGTYAYRVSSADGTNTATTMTGNVTVDSTRPLVVNGASMPAYFSPNNDTIQDAAPLTATVNYDDVQWTITIRDTNNAIVRTIGPTLTPVWDGKNDAGQLLPDATYTGQSQAQDGTATSGPYTHTITLDTTYPVASITTPTGGQSLSNVYQNGSADVSVTGTASDLNLNTWRLEYAPTSNPTSWTTIGNGTTSITSAQLALWQTLNLTNASYLLRLTVNDRAGNQSVLTNTNTSGNFSITSGNTMQINNATGESITYTSTVPFTLTETLTLSDLTGAVVKTLVSAQRGAGSYNDAWNGRNAAGALLPVGGYLYKATVTDGTQTMTWDLSNQYRPGQVGGTSDELSTPYDPYNNKPLRIRFFAAVATRLTIQLAPSHINNTGKCDNPVEYCWVLNEYAEGGAYIGSAAWRSYYWAGADRSGTLRPDLNFIIHSSRDDLFQQNAVVLYGTRPELSGISATPAVYYPARGNQTITFAFTTYQSQAASFTVTFRNAESHSILRTVTIPNQAAGNVSVTWDGRADNGSPVASGTYVITASLTDGIGNRTDGQVLTTVLY